MTEQGSAGIFVTSNSRDPGLLLRDSNEGALQGKQAISTAELHLQPHPQGRQGEELHIESRVARRWQVLTAVSA